MYGVEAGGKGLETGQHAAPLSAGSPGVLHGNRTYLMQDQTGKLLRPTRFLPDWITRRRSRARLVEGYRESAICGG